MKSLLFLVALMFSGQQEMALELFAPIHQAALLNDFRNANFSQTVAPAKDGVKIQTTCKQLFAFQVDYRLQPDTLFIDSQPESIRLLIRQLVAELQ